MHFNPSPAYALRNVAMTKIATSLLLLSDNDPVKETLKAAQSALQAMFVTMVQWESDSKKDDEAHKHEMAAAQALLASEKEKVTDSNFLIATLNNDLKERDSQIASLTDALKKAQAKKDYSDEWKDKAKVFFKQKTEWKKKVQNQSALEHQIAKLTSQLRDSDEAAEHANVLKIEYFQKWKACESKHLSLLATHHNAMVERDKKIASLSQASDNTVPKPVHDEVVLKLHKSEESHHQALLFWSQEKIATAGWKAEAQNYKKKYVKANKQLLMVEQVTAEMRSLVVDAISFGEDYTEKFFASVPTALPTLEGTYKDHHFNKGEKWHFPTGASRKILQWIVERNDAIREGWDEKLKELQSAC